ncbi:MAG: hypothetical protein SXA11_14025 [Cyanobacteriota bacterium]|nr:hypothetical protein [Cyanobacteriota bacterium]
MTEAQTITIPTVGISQKDSDRLKQLYALPEPERVWQFLEKHPFLVPLLLEAPTEIKHHFPADSLSLEMAIDPESTSEDDELFLLIVTNIEAEEAVEKMWNLDEKWWLKASRKSQNKLEISLG